MFTTLLTLAAPVGTAIGFVLPGVIVGSADSPPEGKDLFMRLLLIEAVIATVLCVPLFVFYKEKPPTPPSPSAERPRENFKSGVINIFKNRNFLALLVVEAVSIGTFNSLATVIQSIVDPFGYTQVKRFVVFVLRVFFPGRCFDIRRDYYWHWVLRSDYHGAICRKNKKI